MRIELVILMIFMAFVVGEIFNLSTRIKLLFGIRISKMIKPLDCFPCFTWWISVVTSVVFFFNSGEIHIFEPMAAFLIAKLYERTSV